MAQGAERFWNRYVGPMTDRAEYEDPLGGQSMMGGDAASQAIIEDMLMGRGDQYSPGGLDADPEPGDPIQDYIRQQLAGDVVPLRTHPVQTSDVKMRLGTPGVYRGSLGAQSIEAAGGRQSPYLDLMDVLTGKFGK
jgi:hypothetical protein